MVWGCSTKLCCICDCSLQGIISSAPLCEVIMVECIIFNLKKKQGKNCRAIKQSMQGMVIVNTWVFILRRYKWHIHAGSWSFVNCWREALTRHYIRCSWILMNAAVGLMDGLGLDGDRCIRVIPWRPPFSIKKRLCLHAKKLLLEIYYGP